MDRQNFVFLADKVKYEFTDAIVTSMDVLQENPHYDSYNQFYGSRLKKFTPPSDITVNFSIKCMAKDFCITDETFVEKKINLKDKKVEDCNVTELLFAIKKKINKRKSL